ncbi:hypothetical protein BJF86_07145 [Serinicoccus sp. CNJ-927]|uniref:anti-sigma factor n=1 Tax=Serinicoccus sp. CNJ-927 TaxID=1904970 RepID=UPI00095FB5A6|nr:anti-sigma factor [Serinicoccus sp. CNJ-927]OLT39625.1 hypothetical protein BJF86_07145 [Serinicoccus sp. CNJ-927]
MNADRSEAARHERAEALLRRAGALDSTPSPATWDRIRAEVRTDSSETSPPPSRSSGTASPPPSQARRERRAHRARPARWPLLAAAAVGALVAWLGTAVLGDVTDDPGVVVADADLADLPDAGQTVEGTAEVLNVDGGRRLRVELAERPDAGDGYLEVWLLRPDTSGMVTIGVISGTQAEFSLPDGVELSEYPVVDISRERLDGDPTHGGESLVRGELRQASAGNDAPVSLNSANVVHNLRHTTLREDQA